MKDMTARRLLTIGWCVGLLLYGRPLPADEFDDEDAGAPGQAKCEVAIQKMGEGITADQFRVELESAEYTVNKRADYRRGTFDCRTNNSLTLFLAGPKNVKVVSSGRGGVMMRFSREAGASGSNSPLATIDKVLDGKGVDLVTETTSTYWRESYVFGRGMNEKQDNGVGSVSVNNLAGVDNYSGTFALISGSISLPVVKEELKITLKPVSENLNKPVVVTNDLKVTFTELKKDSVAYTILDGRAKNKDGNVALSFRGEGVVDLPGRTKVQLLDSAGQEMRNHGYSSSGSGSEMKYTQSFAKQGSTGGISAVITFPAKVEIITVPVKLENIPVPKGVEAGKPRYHAPQLQRTAPPPPADDKTIIE
ncbi:MAG: hypothetical protein C0404_00555 [Verrucomicrobia bacterium]|nr:hypothetical protein [Verrucomicrobiota bacterium]